MLKQLRPSLVMLAALTLLTGIVYPVLVMVVAQVVFSHQANGSILHVGDKTVGSELIGQPFSEPGYFWGRLSATSPFPYNAAASNGSNFGPLNPALKKAAESRIAMLRKYPTPHSPVPVVSLRRRQADSIHISVLRRRNIRRHESLRQGR